MNYKAYDDYITSKTYLLDEIPSHWEIIPMNQFVNLVTDYVANGSFASLRNNVEYKNEVDYAILVRLADNSNNFTGPFVYINEDAYNFLSKSKLYEGDIVLTNTGSIGSIFKVPNLGKPMSLGPNSLLIRFNNQILANYFFYLFSCDVGTKFLESITTVTTQPKFNKTDFRKLPMLMPPLEEQKQIANYLDNKTSKINTTIAKNKELINLLEEKRTALINQVVTKGLNPEVPMKDSGIKWIGEIPRHWGITNLKFVANLQTGTTPKNNIGITQNEGINWFTPGDFDNTYKLEKSNKNITSKAIKNNNIKVYPPNSILMVCIGATIGKLGATKDISYSNQQITAILPKLNINYKFLLYYLISKTNYIKNTANFTTLPILNNQHLSLFITVIPPSDEQKQIGKYLDNENNKINKTIEKIKENIELLEEYKTSLIHHVVTGKIDVRGEEI